MTPKVNKAFSEAVTDLAKAESQLHSLNTAIIGPNKGQILGPLSGIESRINKTKLDFAKSDGSVINLKKNLEDLHDEYNWVRDYFRTATFTLKPNQRETVKYVLQSYEKEMLHAIQTIEDRVIRAAANMLKANP